MAKNKKIDQEKLNEFFEETKGLTNDVQDDQGDTPKKVEPKLTPKPFQCPSCHKALSSRKEPCKHCGYKGYIPMSDDQIKKTRFILFIVILAVAIVVYILTR